MLLLVLAAGCGVEPPRGPAVKKQAVLGGAPEPGSPAVGAIVPVAPTCGEPVAAAPITCTGTLVAPRVVLTAAHCVENEDAPQVLSVVFASEPARALASERVRTVEGRLHPAWRAGENDIGVLILSEDAPVAPVTLDGTGLPEDVVGRLTRVVGFGIDDQGSTGGRRSGTARVTAVGQGTFAIEAAPGMTCGGDSGGPSFLELDGTERLVGVTSFGDLACTRGTNTRVDVHAEFLRTILDEVARAPPTRPALDLTVDACTAVCQRHADCPLGMACVTRPGGDRSCAVAGLEAGRFGAACIGAEGARLCVKAGETCRLWLPCAEAQEGGCSAGGGAWALPALIVLAAWLRPSTRATRRTHGEWGLEAPVRVADQSSTSDLKPP